MPNGARQILYGALTAGAVTFTACFIARLTADLTGGLLGTVLGCIIGVLLAAPAMPLGFWAATRRQPAPAMPSAHPAPRDIPPPPDTGPILAALEAAAERDREADERAFDARIAAAECEALGHDPVPDLGYVEVVAWGCTEPLVAGPRCLRCGTRLDTVEGNENATAGVRTSKKITYGDRVTPDSDRGNS
ncbi:hypothetical protein [Actinomadura geliboluensis]|uniref:hypothetical protein n=1 Tax=Actinomadura geliboluensis TaxID=882440 RepID=UPI003685A0B4